jgi:hypothetical protein
MPVTPKSLSFHLFLEANQRLWAEKTEVGCEQVRAERREMLTAHRIFIMAKSQPKARDRLATYCCSNRYYSVGLVLSVDSGFGAVSSPSVTISGSLHSFCLASIRR